MKITKSNSNKNLNNKNNVNSLSNTNNNINNNLNVYNNSIEKRKKDKNQVKTSNYYDKYIINSNKNKSIKNKNQNNNNDDISKNKQENNKNWGVNKYTVYENTYQNIYKSKKERIKTNNNNNQINNCLNYKNCLSERIRENSIKNKTGFTKINNSTLDNIMISYSQIQSKQILNIFKNKKTVASKEKAYYLLSISPVLKLSEQIIFSRASENIRKVISINNIIQNNKIFLTMKAKELINEITLCEKKINKPFTASKTADITLNFITTLDEQEFKDFDNYETNKKLLNIYYSYIKLFCILLNVNYSNDLENTKIKNNLYEKIKEKGFINLKDYFYFIYIGKNEDFKILPKIDIINNEIISPFPDLLNIQQSIKLCRFTAFSNYLLKEIINYGNYLKDLFELKYRAQYFLEIILSKIEKIENYKNKSKS